MHKGITHGAGNQSHSIHVWCLYLRIFPPKSTIQLGEDTSPMDGMGMIRSFEYPEILGKNLTHFDGRRYCLNGLKITS